jgi:hypothetical protein
MSASSKEHDLTPDPWWKFWTNPIIIRYSRSRLRLKRSLGWILAVFIVTSFLFFTTYITSINRDLASSRDAARGVLIPLFFIQGFIMMLMGTGSVASGLVQDKIAGTLDYSRLTPMGPLAKIIGYLLGLPIREYLLFAITFPYTVFALWKGQIPLSVSVPVYTIFFTAVLLYHLTGMAAGMIARKWRFTARLTQGTVILLYAVLPHVSALGLYAFDYLTVYPVLTAKLIPLIPSEFMPGAGVADAVQQVPFYIWRFSPFQFSLVLQLLLIMTLGMMAYRKWRDQNQHALGKRFGMGIYSFVALLVLGNLWPILTKNSTINLPLAIPLTAERVNEGLAMVLPMILAFFLLFVGLWILNMVTPAHHEVLRGWRRVFKFGKTRLAWWQDEAPSAVVLSSFLAVAFVAIGTEMTLLMKNGFLVTDHISWLERLALPAAFFVALVSYYAALISLENRRLVLLLILIWGLPVLLAIFMGAALSSYEFAIYLSSLSPVFLIIYGATFLGPDELGNATALEYATIARHAFWIGIVFQCVLSGWLLVRWRGICKRLVEIARSGSKSVPVELLESNDD